MLLPREELEKLGELHPEIAKFMESHPPPPMDTSKMTVETMRTVMAKMEAGTHKDLPAADPQEEFYHSIPMRDGFMSQLKIHKPGSGPPGPLIVLAFGGGFVGGTMDQLTFTARPLKTLFGATVVSISYRLAPEWKFPYAQNDTEDSMRWIASNATSSLLNSDPTKGFLMGGVSAGGALTASFSRIFQSEPLQYPLTGQWLGVPSTMETELVPNKYKPYHISPEQFADGKFFSRSTREWLKGLVQHDVNSPLRFAINSTNDIAGQPRTYFQVDGLDPLRDDGLVYEEMLKEAGVETKLDLYPGCPHGHFHGYPGLEIYEKANVDTIVGFGWLLGREVSRAEAGKALGYSN